jgi:hypothetical protein
MAARRAWTRGVVAAALLVGPLLAAELGVRLLIATDRLPVAAAHAPEFEISWQNLARLGRADVLIIGDSSSQQDLEPAVLTRMLRQQLGRTLSVFNIAGPGNTVGVNWAIVEQLAREGRLPRVAIVGIYPGSLQDDAIYRDVFSLTPMGGLFSDCERMRDYGQQLSCRLASVSAAWRWRGHPDRIVRALSGTVPRRSHEGGLQLRQDGFREGDGVTLDRIQAQMDAADLRRRIFVFPDEVQSGYVRLIEALRANGVAVVPVAIPDTPPLIERMERMQPGRRQLFRDALDVLEARTGLPFVDPISFGDWWKDGEARNFNHLSASGAIKFTRQLWEMPEFREALLAGLGG